MENVSAFVEDLLNQMTLEEKVGQMSLFGISGTEQLGVAETEEAVIAKVVRSGQLGSIIQPCKNVSGTAKQLQRIAVEESRLKIPLFVNCDVIHGFETVFPIPIAASCSFDPELVEQSARICAKEAASAGICYTNAPMLDVSHDPRWGRVAECQGEDPYLAGRMARAYVNGFQSQGVMATLKHFAGYGACEGGRDYDAAEVCENTMLNRYLIPFREGVAAGADSVMCSFNTIENIPASGNVKYLRKILRDRFGFDGVLISDAMSITEMKEHGVCEDDAQCALMAVKAGVDIELGPGCYLNNIPTLIESGELSIEYIDEAVRRILTKKAELGLFDDPYKYFCDDESNVLFTKDNLDLSEELALECPVLLENDGTLPLKGCERIAVIGKLAKTKNLLGCWQDTDFKEQITPLCEGFKDFEVVGVTESYNLNDVEIASYKADTVVFTVGEFGNENGEAASKNDLEFSEEVYKCYDYLQARGKRVIVLVFAGRPLIVNRFKRANALMYCWNLGHRSTEAVVKLLTGAAVPSGKLTMTFPRSVGQIPVYYNHKPTGRPFLQERQDYFPQARYANGDNYVQYPFGYGLSYTTFEYENVKLSADTMHGDSIIASVSVKNTGKMQATEIVQLYIRDCVSEVSLPVRELKGFKRVSIKPGEAVDVEFTITEEDLKYYHSDSSFLADAGRFIVYVGGSSLTENSAEFMLIK